MPDPVLTWIIANKQWCLTALGSAAAGAFAFLKWVWPLRKGQSSEIRGEKIVDLSGSGTEAMRIEGSVTGCVIAGSNNVQTVTINHAVSHIHLPISERKPSSPTLEEIRIREED